jgi:hypothetical protein
MKLLSMADKKFVILFFIILIKGSLFAQMTPQWVNVYGRPDYTGSWPEQIVSDSMGNSYVLDIVTNFNTQENTCHDPHLRKINSAGITEWKINFGTVPCSDEGAFDLKIFGNNLYVYYSNIDTAQNSNNLYASKVSLNGAILWTKLLQKNFPGYYNEANAAIDKYGTSYIASFFSKSVKRITNSGEILDSIKIFADGIQCYNSTVEVNSDGKILISSFYESGSMYNQFLSLCDSAGTILWTRPVPANYSPHRSRLLYGGNSSYYEYNLYSTAAGYSVFVNKFSQKGYMTWRTELKCAQPQVINMDLPKMLNAGGGNLIIGYTASTGGAAIVKLNSVTGDTLWTFRLSQNIGVSSIFADLTQDNEGNIYALCETLFPNYWQNGNSYAIIKLSTDGVLLRKTFNDGVLQKTFYPSFISLTPNNDVLISGVYMLYANGYEQTGTIKYSQPVNVNSNNNTVPEKFSLLRCYPNPFNPATTISFQIPNKEFASLVVYDLNGRVVSYLVNEKLNAGEYKINFDGSALTSGIYFYKLTAGEFSDTRKMVLVK